MAAAPLSISLHFNCGFCRVSIKELSHEYKFRKKIDEKTREEKFREQFHSAFNLEEMIFDKPPKYSSLFNRRCNQILNCFSKKWNPSSSRGNYVTVFSILNWEKLSRQEKNKHSLSECERCRQKYFELQCSFPCKPVYHNELCSKVGEVISHTTQKSKKIAINLVLSPLDIAFQAKFGESFTTAIARNSNVTGLQLKRSDNEIRDEKRKISRAIRDDMNQQLSCSTPLSILAENQSLATYKRQRIAQYFEQNSPKKKKSHSPATQNWDTSGLIAEFETFPEKKKIIWQQLAEKHGITGPNRGQICKEYIIENTSIDLAKYTYVSSSTPSRRKRVSRKKLSGGEISYPVPPAHAVVKNNWDDMIKNGVLSLGIQCVPYSITRVSVYNGNLVQNDVSIHGRKIPLLELRKRLLDRHEKWMRLPTDEDLQAMSHNDIMKLSKEIGITCMSIDDNDELRSKIKQVTRQRYLAFWHDHATILGHGYVLVTVSVMYDRSVFTANACQSFIEEPEIHILGLSSSSADDQVAFIPDRYECLNELNQVVHSSNGVPIHDVARFFIGDHPAQNFERGTQQGGHYKCGGCGILSHMIGDFPHAANMDWRGLEKIQTIAINGTFGSNPGKLKPFHNLSVDQMRLELSARGQFDISKCKPQLANDLTKYLKGVQRVPTLIISDPTKPLSQSCLSSYEILESEPLHDIKGHLTNLFEEVPFLLDGTLKGEICGIINNCLRKEKINCADLRCLVMHCFLFLKSKSVNWKIKSLISTITEITGILYSRSYDRCPKLVLRLYNLSWLHHELCVDLFQKTRKITMTKMFGTYFHALFIHAPRQYELISLSSVNTEKQERLFGQARMAATTASNRKPYNVIKSVLLHIQSKSLIKQDGDGVIIDSRVSKLAKSCPKYKGTSFQKSFIQSRVASWQSHLERIAPFLIYGPGCWWEESEQHINFFDGAAHISQKKGPELLHFRSHQIPSVIERCQEAWKSVLEKKICIPADTIKIYDWQGDVISIWRPNSESCPIPTPTTPISTPSESCLLPTQSIPISIPSEPCPVPTPTSRINIPSEPCPVPSPTTPISIPSESCPVPTPTNPSSTPSESCTVSTPTNPISTPSESCPVPTPTYPISTPDSLLLPTQSSPINTPSESCPVPISTTLATSSKTHMMAETEVIINPDNFELPKADSTRITYKTKLAQALARLLGNSNDLQEFDEIRIKVKKKKSKCGIKKHDELLIAFQTQALKQKASLKQKLMSTERSGSNDEEQALVYKQYSLAVKLLRSWDITL